MCSGGDPYPLMTQYGNPTKHIQTYLGELTRDVFLLESERSCLSCESLGSGDKKAMLTKKLHKKLTS